MLNVIIAFQRYRFLIKQLVSRDFKTKYKRSVLGVMWSFLNPLLTMLVQYVVFSTLFHSAIPNFPVYLICGIVLFGFFTESAHLGLESQVVEAVVDRGHHHLLVFVEVVDGLAVLVGIHQHLGPYQQIGSSIFQVRLAEQCHAAVQEGYLSDGVLHGGFAARSLVEEFRRA